MNVRDYQPADLPQLIATYTSSIRRLAAAYYTPEQINAWAPDPPDLVRWKTRLENLSTLIVESDGAVAGFSSYTPAGYLDFLFTHPAFARRRVGTQLCLHVESALRAGGAKKITAHVSLAARPFFDRQGFTVDSEETVECRGTCLRRFAMHKDLG